MPTLLTNGVVLGVSYKPYWKYENAFECMYLIRLSKNVDVAEIALAMDKRFMHLDHKLGPVFSKQVSSDQAPFLHDQVEWATVYYAWKGIEKHFDRYCRTRAGSG